MKFKIFWFLSISLFSIICSGCVRPRPEELRTAEQELLDVAGDEYVIQKSPAILEQAARTYHRAEITWRNTGSSDATVPLALLAQDLIQEARDYAGPAPEGDPSARASLNLQPLTIERRTGLAEFSDGTWGKKPADSFSTNRINPSEIGKTTSSESLEAGLFFEPGRSGLTQTGQIALIPIADYLASNPKKKLVIEVHTNRVNSSLHDLEIAKEQADSVRNYFVGKGISPARLESQGMIGDLSYSFPVVVFNYLP
jgi:outer membrane protein OmpA-like peptidoglycan-associated protein